MQSTEKILAFLFQLISLTLQAEAVRPGIPFLVGSYLVVTPDVPPDGTGSPSPKHQIVKEEVLYSRWRTITSRLVRFPNGHEVDFDIVGQTGSNRAVLIFAWDSKTKTITMLKEYMPGSNSVLFGVAAGLVEDKHSGEDVDICLTAAKFELEEEAHLVGGTWIQLTDDTIMDKYATTSVRVYLVLDPQKAVNPKPRDKEEDITIVPGVTVAQVLDKIAKGEMNVVGGWASLVALQKLRELGEIQ